jgi:hypothetical protein
MANANKNVTARSLLLHAGNVRASVATTANNVKTIDKTVSRNAAIAARRASFQAIPVARATGSKVAA